MKKESLLGFGLLFVLLAAGCSSNKNKIWFASDEPGAPAGKPAQTIPSASTRKLVKEDLFKVQVAVYGDLLKRHFADGGGYSAIFLQGDDAEVAALIKQFPNHIPPIKPSDQVDLQPNRAPMDKQTGKPAMIFSVDTLEPVDDTVQAIGKWYAGGAVSGFYTYSLRKVAGDWVIESAK